MTPRTDVNAFIGDYPFRSVPHPDPDALVRVMDREEIAQAWVGSLPAVWHRDPTHANEALIARLTTHASRLRPVPTIRPDWPQWRDALRRCADHKAPAIRAYPAHWGLGADDPRVMELAAECAGQGIVLVLTVRFEDLRQRHSLDVAADLSAASVRELARADTGARIVVTAASRDMIEEVHWGLTPNERAKVWWDISWLWGPPEDHLAHLLRTIGSERFVFGTGWPLRLAQTPRANLALLPDELRTLQLGDPSTWS
jgi:predicted TIM-barrel fold metal-dependent hydrolase